jgi:rhizosphere induced protein
MLTIYFTNKTNSGGNICLFQRSNSPYMGQALPLAWAVQKCGAQSNCTFSWETKYCFAWGVTGPLMPGVVFTAAQILPADPGGNNSITLDKSNGFLQFTNPQRAGQPGFLQVLQTGTVPFNTASVGIGMNGLATVVIPANPNMTTVFDTRMDYYMAWGDYKTGQALDVESMSNVLNVPYPPNTTLLFVTLNADLTWTISTVPTGS